MRLRWGWPHDSMQVVSRQYGSSVSIGRTYNLLGNRVAMPVVRAVAVEHAMAET